MYYLYSDGLEIKSILADFISNPSHNWVVPKRPAKVHKESLLCNSF